MNTSTESNPIPVQLDHEWKTSLGERLDKQDSILDALLTRQDTQDKALAAIAKGQDYFATLMTTWNGAMAFFNVVGRIAKPIIWTGGILSSVWLAWKAGK